MRKLITIAATIAAMVCMFNAEARGGGGGGHSSGARSGSSHASVRSTPSTARVTSTGSHPIRGYVKKDGTYVAPAHATNPNGTQKDNYTAKGNVNPYTGKEGMKEPTK